MSTTLRQHSLAMIQQAVRLLVSADVVSFSEYQAVMENLRSLAKTGRAPPPVEPRLITQAELATMLSLGLSTLKRLEKQNAIPLRPRWISGSKRYYLPEAVAWLAAQPVEGNSTSTISIPTDAADAADAKKHIEKQ